MRMKRSTRRILFNGTFFFLLFMGTLSWAGPNRYATKKVKAHIKKNPPIKNQVARLVPRPAVTPVTDFAALMGAPVEPMLALQDVLPKGAHLSENTP